MGCYLGMFFPLVCLISGYNLSQIYYIYNLFACLDINNLRTPLFCFPQWYIPISKSVFFPSNHLFSSFLLSSHSPLFYFFANAIVSSWNTDFSHSPFLLLFLPPKLFLTTLVLVRYPFSVFPLPEHSPPTVSQLPVYLCVVLTKLHYVMRTVDMTISFILSCQQQCLAQTGIYLMNEQENRSCGNT